MSIACEKNITITVKQADPYAYYKCDEADAAAELVDQIAARNISWVSVPTVSVAGKIATAVKIGFIAAFSRASFSDPVIGDDPYWNLSAGSFTVRFWINFNVSLPLTDFGFFSIRQATGFDLYYSISDNTIHYEIRLGTNWRDISSPIGGAGWHRIVVWHELAVGIGLQIDNNAAVTFADTNSQPSINQAIAFGIGNDGGDSYAAFDELSVWKRKLSAAELLTDWNSGNGITYPFP